MNKSNLQILLNAAKPVTNALYSSSRNDSLERNIISYLISFVPDQEIELESFINGQISNGKTDMDKILQSINNILTVQNRSIHTFNTMDELIAFKATNNCGESWLDGDQYSVYKY